jgi:hypothetical protein
VLVGSAVSAAWAGVPPVRDGLAIVVLAHLARFCVIPALVACWVVATEPVELRMLLRQEPRGFAPWFRAVAARRWPAFAGAGLAVGALSLHEIESAVMVVPPGPGNLPQQILEYLHFWRREEMSAAGVILLGLGLVSAVGASALLAWGGASVRKAPGSIPENR